MTEDVVEHFESSVAGLAFTLKPEQKKAMRHLFNRRDVMAVSRTGFGKSLIFQLLVLMCGVRSKRQGGKGFANVIVIVPSVGKSSMFK